MTEKTISLPEPPTKQGFFAPKEQKFVRFEKIHAKQKCGRGFVPALPLNVVHCQSALVPKFGRSSVCSGLLVLLMAAVLVGHLSKHPIKNQWDPLCLICTKIYHGVVFDRHLLKIMVSFLPLQNWNKTTTAWNTCVKTAFSSVLSLANVSHISNKCSLTVIHTERGAESCKDN